MKIVGLTSIFSIVRFLTYSLFFYCQILVVFLDHETTVLLNTPLIVVLNLTTNEATPPLSSLSKFHCLVVSS